MWYLNFVPCTLTSVVPTHNVGSRTQGRGRYERPVKVGTHDGHQAAISSSSRGSGPGVEQRHTPQAPPPVKVSILVTLRSGAMTGDIL